MKKRRLQTAVDVVSKLKTWQLLILLVLMVFVTATLLRLNNLGMIERRNAVIEADKRGDKEEIRVALAELQNYVSSHMNADLAGGVYLQESYKRDSDAVLQQAQSSSNPNSQVYQQASVECRSRFQGGVESFRNDYVQCVVSRVGALNQQQGGAASLQLPKADLYRYNYYSPRWSFDLAGLASLLTLLLALLIGVRLLFLGVARMILKRRHASIYS